MNTGLFIPLLNPAITLVLAAAFFGLWLYERDKRYLLLLVVGYFASAVGFLLQYFPLPFAGFEAGRLGSGLGFTSAVACIAVAILLLYGRRVPYMAICLLSACGMASFAWFLFIRPDITWRIYSLNFAFGGICLVLAAELRRLRHDGPVQKVLLAITLLASANFLVRTLVAVSLHGAFLSYDGFYTSIYWTTTQLLHAVVSLMIALCLLTAAALDMMGKLRIESHTDPLSRLLNRRGFEERAAFQLDRCARANLPVTLVVADLDHFKAVNDRYGHAVGDRVISDFAGKLRNAAGTRGIVGRLGGEEFAVLLPLTDLATARLFAEAVRAQLAVNPVDGPGGGIRITASFGAAARSGTELLAPLMCRADEALYKAKQNGRDSVRLSYQRPEVPLAPANPLAGLY